jgi:hypothetical protein
MKQAQQNYSSLDDSAAAEEILTPNLGMDL